MSREDQEPERASGGGSRRAEALFLLLFLAVVVAVHLAVRARQGEPKVWGDETHYYGYALFAVRNGETSLLPGKQDFDHRPDLGARVLAQLIGPDATPAQAVHAASGLQVVLLALLLVLTYVAARQLGLGAPGASCATVLLGIFPWLGFHVHSLWPEVLHALFFALALCAVLAHLSSGGAAWLVLAGLATGYALLTKGSIGGFVPIALVWAFAVTWRRGLGRSRRERLLRALVPALAYGAGVLAVVGPQAIRNHADGHGWRLSANRWWNLELGLTLPGEIHAAAGDQRWAATLETSVHYFQAADTPEERERLARERTLVFLRSSSLPRIAVDQALKLAGLVLRGDSCLEQALTYRERWGAAPPAWARGLERFGRIEWYALWLLGLAGLALRAGRTPGWTFLALFALFFLAGLLLVPFKVRFALPLVPVLCLASGAMLETLQRRLRS